MSMQRLVLGSLLVGACLPVAAQSDAALLRDGLFGPAAGIGWPAGAKPALGLALGRSTLLPCAPESFTLACSQAPGNQPQRLALEFNTMDMARLDRGGSTVRAQGLNLSVVGKTRVLSSLGLYGKLGATWGRTESTAVGGSNGASGTEAGFGVSYGAGVSWEFTPSVSATLSWDSYDFRFAGGRDPVRTTNLGLQWKY